ncbi:MAG: glycerate kinase [Nitriliruptoraceae bacterium]
MQVLIAPDGFKGTLTARAAATAIADGWAVARPGDELTLLPLADGGDGLCDVLADSGSRWITSEVVGPLGRPVDAAALLRGDGTAILESAAACGLDLVPEAERSPMRTTTFGVGQLLKAVVDVGARRVLVGLGGSATVDAGLGALTGLGYRLRMADGSGLKIGGGEVHRLDRIERGWAPDLSAVEVELLADVTTTLDDAARVFGPQKGASEAEVGQLGAALRHAADVVERDLCAGERLRDEAGTGAAGGLGFALAAALGARFVPGAAQVAGLVGLPAALRRADIVVTGEGRLDATSLAGKVVGHVRSAAAEVGIPVVVVAGGVDGGTPLGVSDVEAASPSGPGPDPATELSRGAQRLAARR